ncbi:hypothetical protein ACEWY4_008928 [Coilia grayii]|uniref:Transposase n=1 Tax=Coilia grayii TaxID=363190 RepID=A0ABD1K509_9TELE
MSGTRKDAEKHKKTKTAKQTQNDTDFDSDSMAAVVEELRALRKEHAEASKETKDALARVESTLKELTERTTKLERRMSDAEQRLGGKEDDMQRHQRALGYLLHREANLTAKCEDLEARTRRNNLRIYGIPEGEEKNDMLGFISNVIRTSLALPEELHLIIERAHRSLIQKPIEPDSPPRSIIVRFLDFTIKEMIIKEAWKHTGGVPHDGYKIFFDQDYTTEVQKKRKDVRSVIKQLKEKNIKAQCPFPAKLKIHLLSGVKTFLPLQMRQLCSQNWASIST